MKKFVFIIAIAAGFTACKQTVKGSNGVTYKSPVDYNDYMVTRQTSLMKKIIDFGEVVQTNLDSASRMLDLYEKQTAVMLREIKGMPSYKGDSSLRDAAVKSFNFYKKVFGNEYRQILAIRAKADDQTEDGANEINRIVEKLSQEEEKLDKAFHNAQQDFASRNKMKLIDNEMQKKVDKMKDE